MRGQVSRWADILSRTVVSGAVITEGKVVVWDCSCPGGHAVILEGHLSGIANAQVDDLFSSSAPVFTTTEAFEFLLISNGTTPLHFHIQRSKNS